MLTLSDHNGASIAKDKEIMLIINKFKNPITKRGGAANISGISAGSTISLEEYLDEVTPKIEPI